MSQSILGYGCVIVTTFVIAPEWKVKTIHKKAYRLKLKIIVEIYLLDIFYCMLWRLCLHYCRDCLSHSSVKSAYLFGPIEQA